MGALGFIQLFSCQSLSLSEQRVKGRAHVLPVTLLTVFEAKRYRRKGIESGDPEQEGDPTQKPYRGRTGNQMDSKHRVQQSGVGWTEEHGVNVRV